MAFPPRLRAIFAYFALGVLLAPLLVAAECPEGRDCSICPASEEEGASLSSQLATVPRFSRGGTPSNDIGSYELFDVS